MITATPLFLIIFLLAACILSAERTALMRTQENDIEERMRHTKSQLAFFRWLDRILPEAKISASSDFLSFTSIIALIGYGLSIAIYLSSNHFFTATPSLIWLIITLAIATALALFVSIFFHLFALKASIATLKLFTFLSILLVCLFLPISFPFIWMERRLSCTPKTPQTHPSPDELRDRLLELLEEMEEEGEIEATDSKMIKSVAQFGKLVVREIMVPRVDMVCLSENDHAKAAYDCFVEHGYSRVPIYKDSVDHIAGMILYKSFMEYCFNEVAKGKKLESIPITPLIVPILYAPENKRIRDLLVEIRHEKVHAAIVVNEYGCTEGMVTIEDVLEELVGSEIRDELDEDEAILFRKTQDKSWIVDGRMNIVDVARELGIIIPHNAEYETIAGFISWKMGTIPTPGTEIYEDLFKLRILESDKRQIHKVKITSI